MTAELDECRVPPLTQLCYQTVAANLDRFSSSSVGHCSYRLMKPILESCSAETLKQLEQEYDDWQAEEYLAKADVDIWQPKCFELLPDALSIYASGERKHPDSWRREYWTLLKERQTLVTRASDRVSKCRVAQESDQRRAKLTNELPPGRRRNGSPLHAISNPAFRKVVAETRRLSFSSPIGTVNSAYFTKSDRLIGHKPVIRNVPSEQNTRSNPKSTSLSAIPASRSSLTGNLFMSRPSSTGCLRTEHSKPKIPSRIGSGKQERPV